MAEEIIEKQDLGDIEEIDNVPETSQQTVEENIEQQDLGDIEEIDNVPGNSHPQDEDVPENSLPHEEDVPENSHPQEVDVPENTHPQEVDVPENSHPQEVDVPENSHPQEEAQEAENDTGVVEGKKWPGWPGENVFRMLVPAQRVGGIIGRKGENIKKMCEETRARIKILDGPPGTTERAIMVSAKEEPDLSIPPALDGLLKIHKQVVEADSDPANAPSSGTVRTRLLVAGTQAGSLIGKQGGTIKSIQDDSHCNIRVLTGENLPVFALPDDSIVEIQGETAGVHKAVELIATNLRKFLVDRSVVSVFEMQMQMSNNRANQNQNMPPPQSWGPPPPAFSMNPGGHGYESNVPFMEPYPRPYDNYYPPVDMPLEKQSRSGPPTYGRDVSMGAHTANVQPQQAVITKVKQNMQIQLSYADAVIGVNGANISYIRRASGATIAIQETRGVPDEMTVEINGSSSQVQAAQQLIQNSIADAVNSMQNTAGGPPSQGYNPYAPSNAAGRGPTGDYGSVYGSSYGY